MASIEGDRGNGYCIAYIILS